VEPKDRAAEGAEAAAAAVLARQIYVDIRVAGGLDVCARVFCVGVEVLVRPAGARLLRHPEGDGERRVREVVKALDDGVVAVAVEVHATDIHGRIAP
jgi:hypothetical protein